MSAHKLITVIVGLLLTLAQVCSAAENSLSATAAQMTIRLSGGRATGDCVLTFSKSGAAPASCGVFASGLTLTGTELSPGLALLGEGGIAATAQAAGEYRATLRFTLNARSREGVRELDIPVPQSAAAMIRLVIPGENADVASDVPLEISRTPEATVAVLYPGARTSVRVGITPAPALREGENRLTVKVSGEFFFRDGLLGYRASHICKRLSGESGRLILELPQGWTLERLIGPEVLDKRPLDNPEEGAPRVYEVLYSPQEEFKFWVVCSYPLGYGDRELPFTLPMPREAARAEGTVRFAANKQTALSYAGLAGGQPEGPGFAVNAPQVSLTVQSRPQRFRYDCALSVAARLEEQLQAVRGELQINVREGGRYRMALRAAPGLRLVGLTGTPGMQWRQEGEDVIIECPQSIDGRLFLKFTGESARQEDGFILPWLLPREPERAALALAFVPPDGFDIVRAGGNGGLRQIDPAGLPEWMRPAQLALQGEAAAEGMRLQLRRIPPSVDAVCALRTVLAEERASHEFHVQVNPRRIAIFRHQISLGRGLDVTAVEGALIRDWDYAPESGMLTVSLTGACPEDYYLFVRADAPLAREELGLALPLPYYEGATLMRGFLLAGTTPGWTLRENQSADTRPCSFRDITAVFGGRERFPASAREGEVILAYSGAGLTANLQRGRIPAELRVAQNCRLFFVPGMVRLEAEIEPALARGGVQSLSFRPPAGFVNIEISGYGHAADFRPEDVWQDDAGVFHVRFPSRLAQLPSIRLSGERMLVGDGKFEFSPVRIDGAQRNTGTLATFKASGDGGDGLEVLEQGRDGFQIILNGAGAGSPRGQNRLAEYSFESENAVLRLGVSGAGSRVMQAAKASDCELVSRLNEKGELLTRLRCRMENPGGQQFLAVQMPQGTRIWGAFANGEPIKPVQDGQDARLLMPLAGAGVSFGLDIVYAQDLPSGGGGMRGLALETPRLFNADAAEGMQVDSTRWRLWVPEDYSLMSHGGTLNLSAGRQAGHSYLLEFVYDIAIGTVRLADRIGLAVIRVFFMALPWIVLVLAVLLVVWLAQRRARKGARGGTLLRTALTAGGVLVALLLVFAMLAAPLMNARSSALKTSSFSNLRQIGVAIRIYSSNYGQPPQSLEDLVNSGLIDNRKLLMVPQGGSYGFSGVPDSLQHGSVIAVELLEDAAQNMAGALLYDGSVVQMKNEDIASNLEESGNYALRNSFVDNWQQNAYQQRQQGKFSPRSGRKMASISREAEELQLAQQIINIKQTEQLGLDASEARQKLREYNKQANEQVQELTQQEAEQSDVQQQRSRFNVRNLLGVAEEPQPQKPLRAIIVAPIKDFSAESRLEAAGPEGGETSHRRQALDKGDDDDADHYAGEGKSVEVEVNSGVQIDTIVEVQRHADMGLMEKEERELDARNLRDREVQRPRPLRRLSAQEERSDTTDFSEVNDELGKPATMGFQAVDEAQKAKDSKEDGLLYDMPQDIPALPAAAATAAPGEASAVAAPPAPTTPAAAAPLPAPASEGIAADELREPVTIGFHAENISGGRSGRLGRAFKKTTAGALPIDVTIPRDGAYFEFARGAGSGGAAVNLRFFSRGLSIALELVVAIALSLLLLRLYKHYAYLLLPFCAGLIVVAALALQWAQSAYRPHLSLILAVCVAAAVVDVAGKVRGWLARRLLR